MTTAVATVERVVDQVKASRFAFSNEASLQEGIALSLRAAGLVAEREVRLNARDRIDVLSHRVGIEVKVAGSAESVLRQLSRYAESERIEALVLVTTRAIHRGLPSTVGGKPLMVIALNGLK